MKFDQEQFYKTELELAEGILLKNPQDTSQLDRASYAAAFLGKFDLAEKYSTTEKSVAIIEKYRKKHG